jgi:tricorn protease
MKTWDIATPPWTNSKDMDPAWIGETVYFISDRDGVANIWSFNTANKKLAQLTKYSSFDVKSLDAGAGTIVFEQGGYILELNLNSGKEHIVEITAAGDFPWMMPRWENVENRLASMVVSPADKRVAVEARGEIFILPAEKGDVRNLTHSSGSAERDRSPSPKSLLHRLVVS